MKSTLLVVFSSVVLHVNGMPLMMGKMVGQGETKAEALGQMNPKDVEEVKGKEVAKGANEELQPKDELLMGEKIASFDEVPSETELQDAGVASGDQVEKKKGNVLDNDVQSGSYVAKPAMVLGELLASGGHMPEIEEGEIIAGDPVEVDVLTMAA